MRATLLLLLLPAALLGASCGDDHDHAGHVDAPHADAHVHEAPRGGALVVLAEETAHVEVVLDRTTGRLWLFVLGPHAASPVRVAQPEIAVTLHVAGTEHRVTLPAVANELTGETVGDTSAFAADVEALKGADAFSGEIDALSARGVTYTAVPFTYP